MEIKLIKYYNDLNHRKQLILDGRSRGESVIHDDFIDKQGRSTDGKAGRLTLEIIPDPAERVIKSLDELNLLLFKKEIKYIELLDLLTIQALMEDNKRWNRFKARFGL